MDLYYKQNFKDEKHRESRDSFYVQGRFSMDVLNIVGIVYFQLYSESPYAKTHTTMDEGNIAETLEEREWEKIEVSEDLVSLIEHAGVSYEILEFPYYQNIMRTLANRILEKQEKADKIFSTHKFGVMP